MPVFISYARKDVAAVEALKGDIEHTRRRVWFDRELEGGEAWWRTILRQIRECEVFVFALSPESIKSKACISEWRYALDVHRVVLPVMVRDVNLQLVPDDIATTHIIDYRSRTADSAISLVNALSRSPAPAPLPDPLPDEPPVPISYLRNYRERIEKDSLTLGEQVTLFAELRSHLADDDRRETAVELLRELRTRSDITEAVGKDIDALLGGQRSRPRETPPPPRPRRRRRKLRLLLPLIVVGLAAAGGIALLAHQETADSGGDPPFEPSSSASLGSTTTTSLVGNQSSTSGLRERSLLRLVESVGVENCRAQSGGGAQGVAAAVLCEPDAGSTGPAQVAYYRFGTVAGMESAWRAAALPGPSSVGCEAGNYEGTYAGGRLRCHVATLRPGVQASVINWTDVRHRVQAILVGPPGELANLYSELWSDLCTCGSSLP